MSGPSAFEEIFGPGEAPRCVRAPGRTHLIGEHGDYQEGLVLPLAVEQTVRIWFRRRRDTRLRAHAAIFGQTREVDLERPLERTGSWLDYLLGVVVVLREEGFEVVGLDCLLESDLPIGAGLSSSAAVEVAFALALLMAADEGDVDRLLLARLCRRAENEFVGVGCGIMDQFASLFGRRDHALLLDCRSLDYQLVPLPADRVRVLLADTGLRRGLANSQFNQRLRECAQAVEHLRRWVPDARSLRDVSPEVLERRGEMLPEVLLRRARHVVGEIKRVRQAVDALLREDYQRAGELLLQSHRSLRDDYQVSSPELDAMVEAAMEQRGVYGARLTGAGFGGCVVALVHPEHLEETAAGLKEAYHRKTGRNATVYLTRPADGAGPCNDQPTR